MNEGMKVIYYEYAESKTKKGTYEKVEAGQGTFHCWGIDFEKFDGIAAQFTVAIIEREDGMIISSPAELVQFVQCGGTIQ